MNDYRVIIDFNGHTCDIYEVMKYLQDVDFEPLKAVEMLPLNDPMFNFGYDLIVEDINHVGKQVNLTAISKTTTATYVPELDISIVVAHKLDIDEPIEIIDVYYGKPK